MSLVMEACLVKLVLNCLSFNFFFLGLHSTLHCELSLHNLIGVFSLLCRVISRAFFSLHFSLPVYICSVY